MKKMYVWSTSQKLSEKDVLPCSLSLSHYTRTGKKVWLDNIATTAEIKIPEYKVHSTVASNLITTE